MFPKPLNNVKSEGRETLELHGRKWENCEILTGTTHYDGPLMQEGCMVFDSKCRIALHSQAPFGIVSMEIVTNGKEYSKNVVATLKSTEKLTLIEVGEGAQSRLEAMNTAATKPETPTIPKNVPARELKTQPKESLPQIRQLARILQTQDGDAFRKFVLLGSPAWQKPLDQHARAIETSQHSIIDIVSSRSVGGLVRVGCRFSIDGKQQEHVATFEFVKRGKEWKMLVFFVDENLDDLKSVLTDSEWKAISSKGDDARPK